MEIVIVSGGMPFGPDTLDRKSLGGSETAAINIARALRSLGNLVIVFCPLDSVQRDFNCKDGIRWKHIDDYPNFIVNTEVDLLIVSRNAEFFGHPHQARKAVLWCHDLATHTYTTPTALSLGWNFDEVWVVSEYHRQQWHRITGYPLQNIRVTRNGITPIETIDMGKVPKQLLYAARPERGLENLVRPGGIMSRLPDYKLKITMYDNYPPHMMGYYQQLFAWAQELPNVEVLGPKTQAELRQLMRNSWAYVYPTNFEEVSCILAREAISVHTPFICTAKGALMETLGDCGIYVPSNDVGSDAYNDRFIQEIRLLENPDRYREIQEKMAKREDLDWLSVAEQWVNWSEPKQPRNFSRLWSMIEDSDVIPAINYLNSLDLNEHTSSIVRLKQQLEDLYPYLFGRETFASYYERYYKIEDEKGSRKHPRMEGNPRFEKIAHYVGNLPHGSVVYDYGCAEGVIILGLAQRFPDKKFIGADFAQSNLDLAAKYAAERNLTNVTFELIDGDYKLENAQKKEYDAVICSEVMEHVERPWDLARYLEAQTRIGGKIIITVPQGPWEATGLYDKRQWFWRAHIWHIDKWMIRRMFAKKQHCTLDTVSQGHYHDGRAIGHLVFTYVADGEPIAPIDPLEKALRHRSRQTVAACIIAMNNEATILNLLNSLSTQVQIIQIALGPSTDKTKMLCEEWAKDHPWIDFRIISVPKIEPYKFGFDDARNASIDGIDADWILWIDTDEYLSGDVRKFLRNNAYDAYAIHQHHFTVEPRGAPAQIDKPARLFRNNGDFTFYGKVHEHAEKGPNGGPGFCMMLPEVDIGHPGYVNEKVRRERFNRNFPLLVWDRQVYPHRKLGHYLWLRDIVHRMRYFVELRNIPEARRLAEEAVAFYRSMWKDIDSIGMGGINALGYYSEALALLGRGIQVNMAVQLDPAQPPAQIQGIFETPEEAVRLMEQALKPEFEKRKSGYWQ